MAPQNYFSPDKCCQMDLDVLDSGPAGCSQSKSNEGSRFNATGFKGLFQVTVNPCGIKT